MSTRNRRSPERRQRSRSATIVSGTAGLIGSALARNPSATGGVVVFSVVFSFVAANALWYQPSSHPHPWLDTRDAFRDYAAHAMHAGNGPVTTFKVEHDKAAAPPAARTAAVKAQPLPANAVVVVDQPAQASAADGSDLIAAIQQNLARRGLYDDAPDGKMGPKTQAAILFYQQTRGLPETGQPDQNLLDMLKQDNAEFSVVPAERPAPDVTGAIARGAASKADPVANLIRLSASAKPAAKPAPKTAAATPASAPADKGAPSDLVLQIQKGLAKFSYTNLTVDGVAGDQTREAIRHFETHYHLPVNGEPSEAVLNKLKQIGAL